jgi:hypothetical protein
MGWFGGEGYSFMLDGFVPTLGITTWHHSRLGQLQVLFASFFQGYRFSAPE